MTDQLIFRQFYWGFQSEICWDVLHNFDHIWKSKKLVEQILTFFMSMASLAERPVSVSEGNDPQIASETSS